MRLLWALIVACVAVQAENSVLVLQSVDKAGLRRALLGGEPFLTFCEEKRPEASERLDQFISSVKRELGKQKGAKDIQLAKTSCGAKLSSGSTLQKLYKLKREHSSLPVILWTVNGQAPKQLKAKTFTSAVKGSTQEGGGAGTLVQLDPVKLASKLVKNKDPVLQPLATNDRLLQECLSLKYQLCAVVLKKGGIARFSSSKLAQLQQTVVKHRFVRLFVVDTVKNQLSIEKSLDSTLSDETLVIFKRKDFVFSGNPKHAPASGTSDSSSAESAAEKAEKAQARKELFRSAVTIGKPNELFDPKGSALVTLAYGVSKIASATSLKERLELISQNMLVSPKAIDLKTKSKDLAVLLRPSKESSSIYVLDWEAGSKYVLSAASFGVVPSQEKLASLQELVLERLTRPSKAKGKKSIEGHYIAIHSSDSSSNADLGLSFRRALSLQDKKQFIPFSQRPMLSKLVTKKENPRTSSPRREAFSRASSRGKTSSQPKESREERLDRERKRREEMEAEAINSGIYAMPSDEDLDDEAFEDYEPDVEENDDAEEEVEEEEENDDIDEEISLDDEEEESCENE